MDKQVSTDPLRLIQRLYWSSMWVVLLMLTIWVVSHWPSKKEDGDLKIPVKAHEKIKS